MAKAIHSMIRVLDEKRSADFYRLALRLEVAERLDFETFSAMLQANSSSN